jgi:hypothetical protein
LKSISSYEKLVKKAFDVEDQVPIGFDSCSAPTFLKVINKGDYYPHIKALMNILAEPCESDCFSSYINVDGRFFHCSFTEDEPGWQGIDVLSCKDFLKDVWFAPEVVKFRGKLLDGEQKSGCRSCPIFDLELS